MLFGTRGGRHHARIRDLHVQFGRLFRARKERLEQIAIGLHLAFKLMQPDRRLIEFGRLLFQFIETCVERILAALRHLVFRLRTCHDAVDFRSDLPLGIGELRAAGRDHRMLRPVAAFTLGLLLGDIGILRAQIGNDRRLQDVRRGGGGSQLFRRDLFELVIFGVCRRGLGARIDELVVELRQLTGRKTFPVRIEQIGFGLVLLKRPFGGGEARAHLLDALIEPFAGAARRIRFRRELVGEIGFRKGIGDAGGLSCILRPGIELDDVSQAAALGIRVLAELVDDPGQRITGCILAEQKADRKQQHRLRLCQEAAGAEFCIVQKIEFPGYPPH